MIQRLPYRGSSCFSPPPPGFTFCALADRKSASRGCFAPSRQKFVDVDFGAGGYYNGSMSVHVDVVVDFSTHVQDPQVVDVGITGSYEHDDFRPTIDDDDRIYAATDGNYAVKQFPHRSGEGWEMGRPVAHGSFIHGAGFGGALGEVVYGYVQKDRGFHVAGDGEQHFKFAADDEPTHRSDWVG